MAITLSVAQTVANSFTEVATKAKALFDSLTITTFYQVTVTGFGENKWLITIVYA